jgi:putative transposase
MFGAMIRAADRWRPVKMTDFERRQMAAIKTELGQEYEAHIGVAKPSSKETHSVKISSSART